MQGFSPTRRSIQTNFQAPTLPGQKLNQIFKLEYIFWPNNRVIT